MSKDQQQVDEQQQQQQSNAPPEESKAAADEAQAEAAAAAVTENGDAAPTSTTETQVTPEPKEMRAVVLNNFGGLKAVKILKKPEPSVGEGELLIRVQACGLNFQDLMLRQGAIEAAPKCPFILGTECAGEVLAIGEGVTDFAVGDMVVALPECRAWAEYVSVPTKFAFKLPSSMTPTFATAITMNYAVAYILLFDLAHITSGKSLLVHSAGGGVGLAIAQLARTVPDVKIFGVCSKNKHESLNGTAKIIDHLLERGNDYPNELRKIQPEGVDIVLDCLCGEECNRGYSLLKPMGKYILYGSSNLVTGETKSILSAARSWWQVDKVSPLKLFDENKTLMGFNMRHLLFHQDGAAIVRNAVNQVYALFEAGKIEPLIDSTWALEDVTEAMQKMHERKNVGKIILDPAMEPKPKPVPVKGKKKQVSEEKKEEEAAVKEEKKAEAAAEETPAPPAPPAAAPVEALTNGDAAEETKEGEKKAADEKE